jgi:DNA-binding NarL/FixJ family response regulator
MLTANILVVEDFERFRQFVVSTLRQGAKFEVAEASSGLEALQRIEEREPDLVLLDIGLPGLNGIEVARRLRRLAAPPKIVFISQESSPEIVREALNLGALGYVQKLRAQTDLLPAIEAALEGRRFLSSGLQIGGGTNAQPSHEILFCSGDVAVMDGLAQYIANALKVGNPAIVWATESHREGIRKRLEAQGVAVEAAVRQGLYVPSDVNEPPDAVRISDALRRLREAALKAGKRDPRISACGERAGRFWEAGKIDEAIQLERLLNELAKDCELDVLCTYPSPDGREKEPGFKGISAEHTSISYR